MSDISTKFGLNGPSVNFKDPRLLTPYAAAAANFTFYPSGTAFTLAQTAAFTGLANYGLQDTTNWSANTYKSIYSHTGSGFIHALIGPTAGAAETTTFEITIDGVLREMSVLLAASERAVLLSSSAAANDWFTTAASFTKSSSTNLNAAQTALTNGAYIMPMAWTEGMGLPKLQYDVSCLIRMKHSASITNSVATAYSAVMYRKGIAS